nr:right-handed parallel beta-helix repeat-containing protein [Anaerolineales bacterium]
MPRSFVSPSLALALSFLLALLGRPGAGLPAAYAATQTVTNTNDSGAGSLRQAIAAAGSGDTIVFNLATPATITLTSGALNLNKNLTITGPGADQLTISGGNLSRVFTTTVGTTTAISDLAIAQGLITGIGLGGGVHVVADAQLTLTAVELRDNIANPAAGSGGGLYNAGTLFLENSTLVGNAAAYGGAFLNEGTASLTNCTISGNESNVSNGVVYGLTGTLTMNNCTVTANISAVVEAGVYIEGGTFSFKNSLIAGNLPSNGIGEVDIVFILPDATVTSQGNNLIGDEGTLDYTWLASDLVGDATVGPIDPLLNALAGNGGTTRTHALQAASPAIDPASSNGAPAADQRGYLRNGAADIGAFEYNGFKPQPSSHPTGLTATANSASQITTAWTDAAAGLTPPDGYLVLCGTSAVFTNPVDFTAPANDPVCADGSGLQYVAQGVGTTAWTGLNSSTPYFFKVFPYTNSAANINYKTDGTPVTATATTDKAEPSHYPTAFTATTNSLSQITTAWTDAAGGTAPDGYLVLCGASAVFTSPVDFTAQADDLACADGSGARNVAQGAGSAAWTGLASGTPYYFKIFPYSNAGTHIDYKTDGAPPAAAATTFKTEPSNHPTGLSAAADSASRITTTWSDAAGAVTPDGYLVLCGTSAVFTNPVDFTAPADDPVCADGGGLKYVAPGVGTTAWTGLNPLTPYFFKIFPYTNAGAFIDYKIDGVPLTATATTLNTSTLSVITAGTGAGTLQQTPSGTVFDYGTLVTLTATPALSSTFTGWSGDCSGVGACVVALTVDRSITATFTLKTFTLVTAVAGPGLIQQAPGGSVWDYGTIVTLTAVPTAGSVFVGWSGDLSGLTNPITVTLEANKVVTATFNTLIYLPTIQRDSTSIAGLQLERGTAAPGAARAGRPSPAPQE